MNFALTLWDFRNKVVHGVNPEDTSRILRQSLLTQMSDLYQDPPYLLPRFGCVTDVPLELRATWPTNSIKQWLSRVHHQIQASRYELDRTHMQQRRIDAYFNYKVPFSEAV